jgi:hypothetical protein
LYLLTLSSLYGNTSKKAIPTQSITLSGLGSTQFLRAVKAVETLHRLFLLKYRDLLPLERGEFDNNPTLTFDCKLMAPSNTLTNDTERVELGDLDPANVLGKLLFNRRGAYTSDNVVRYKRRGVP